MSDLIGSKIKSCPFDVSSNDGITGQSAEEVSKQAKSQYPGFEFLVDDYICVDPDSQKYFLDEESLSSSVKQSLQKSYLALNCDTEECRGMESLELNLTAARQARENYEKNIRDLQAIAGEYGHLKDDDPVMKLIATGTSAFASGFALGVGWQILSDAPLEDLTAVLTKRINFLKELYIRNLIGVKFNEGSEYKDYRERMKKCGFQAPLYPKHIAVKLSAIAVSALGSLMTLMASVMATSYFYLTRDHVQQNQDVPDLDALDQELPELPLVSPEVLEQYGYSEWEYRLAQSEALLSSIKDKEGVSKEIKEILERIDRNIDSGNYSEARRIYDDEFKILAGDPTLFKDDQTASLYLHITTLLEDIFSLSQETLWLRQNPVAMKVGVQGLALGGAALALAGGGEKPADWARTMYKAQPHRTGVLDVFEDLDKTVDKILQKGKEASLTGAEGVCTPEALEMETMIQEALQGVGEVEIEEAEAEMEVVEDTEAAEVTEDVIEGASESVAYAPLYEDVNFFETSAQYGWYPVPEKINLPEVTMPEWGRSFGRQLLFMEPAYAPAYAAAEGGVCYASDPVAMDSSHMMRSQSVSPAVQALYPDGHFGSAQTSHRTINLEAGKSVEVSFAEVGERLSLENVQAGDRIRVTKGGEVVELTVENGKPVNFGLRPGETAKVELIKSGALKAGSFVKGAVVFTAVALGGEYLLERMDAPEAIGLGFDATIGVTGLYFVASQPELILIAPAALGGGEFVGEATGLALDQLDLDPALQSTLETGAKIGGGIGVGAGAVVYVNSATGGTGLLSGGASGLVRLAGPIAAVGMVFLYGGAAIHGYRQSAKLEEALAEKENWFRNNVLSHPEAKDLGPVFDEAIRVFEATINGFSLDFGPAELAKLKSMARNPKYQAVFQLMGDWFYQKYCIPLEKQLDPVIPQFRDNPNAPDLVEKRAWKAIGDQYGSAIHAAFLDVLYPGMAQVTHEFQSRLNSNFDAGDLKVLQDIVSDPKNEALFVRCGPLLTEAIVNPWLDQVGYHVDRSWTPAGTAYEWYTGPDQKEAKLGKKFGVEVATLADQMIGEEAVRISAKNQVIPSERPQAPTASDYTEAKKIYERLEQNEFNAEHGGIFGLSFLFDFEEELHEVGNTFGVKYNLILSWMKDVKQHLKERESSLGWLSEAAWYGGYLDNEEMHAVKKNLKFLEDALLEFAHTGNEALIGTASLGENSILGYMREISEVFHENRW